MKSIALLLVVLLFLGCSNKKETAESTSEQMLVYVGDSQARVIEMLGDPSIEFPKDGTVVQWYAGYEVVLSNGLVVAVTSRPIMNEEEGLEKEERARLANERLLNAYEAVAQQEKIDYAAWLERERKRAAERRAELARVEAYNDRVSSEKRAEIYAEGMSKSCGCLNHVHCHHHWHWVRR